MPATTTTTSPTTRSSILFLDHAETSEQVAVRLVLLPEVGTRLVTIFIIELDRARLHERDERRLVHRRLGRVVNVLHDRRRGALRRGEHEPGAEARVPAELLGRGCVRKDLV